MSSNFTNIATASQPSSPIKQNSSKLIQLEKFISKQFLIFLIIIFIFGIIGISYYESEYDPDKEYLSFWTLFLVNTVLSIGGLIVTVVANYITEKYTLDYLNHRFDKLAEHTANQGRRASLSVVDTVDQVKQNLPQSPKKKRQQLDNKRRQSMQELDNIYKINPSTTTGP